MPATTKEDYRAAEKEIRRLVTEAQSLVKKASQMAMDDLDDDALYTKLDRLWFCEIGRVLDSLPNYKD